jgi:hypothetical protein
MERKIGPVEREKLWLKPELLILARSKPEELVLSFCKTDPGGGGAGNEVNRCDSVSFFCAGNCAVEGAS